MPTEIVFDMQEERIVFVDYVRVVACLLVMVVHAAENFYGADASGLAGNMSMLLNEDNRLWVAIWDSGIARTCVPLFITISAFLLVPMRSGTTMTSFYSHRFKRILPPVLIFMLLYSLLPLLWNGMTTEQSVKDILNIPFNFPSMAGHLWFMYPLISIYLIIPVVSPWLAKASAKDERIYLSFFVLSTFIPFIHQFVKPEVWGECFWNRYDALWYCSGYLGYLVMAHYIRFHLTWSTNKRLTVGAICFVTGTLFTIWSFWWRGVPGQLIETPKLEWAMEFCTPNILAATFGVFLMFSAIKRAKAPAIVTELSKLSFGMYLMHLFFINLFAKIFIGNGGAGDPVVYVGLAIPLIGICTFIGSAVTTKILSYIPGSKWIIG